MITTKPIKAGEQIVCSSLFLPSSPFLTTFPPPLLGQWNTYGDPPNSDLLRRYGHIDIMPLRPPLSGEGNPADIVEIRADILLSCVPEGNSTVEKLQERIDWWLEFAEDEYVFAS